MTHQIEHRWCRKVIASCKTDKQRENCLNLIENYGKKHGKIDLYYMLHLSLSIY